MKFALIRFRIEKMVQRTKKLLTKQFQIHKGVFFYMGYNPRAAFFDNTKLRKFLEDMLKSVIQLLNMEKMGFPNFKWRSISSSKFAELTITLSLTQKTNSKSRTKIVIKQMIGRFTVWYCLSIRPVKL